MQLPDAIASSDAESASVSGFSSEALLRERRKVSFPTEQRPGSVPTQPLRLRVLSVPKDGGVTVRFLANPVGVLTHGKTGLSACPGIQLCPSSIHNGKTVWKGFAPCELWRDAPNRDWLQTVLEVTERLAEFLGRQPLRGSVWYLYRVLGDTKHKECAGHQVDALNPAELPIAFNIEPSVCRLFREPRVLFGVDPPLAPRAVITPTADGYEPPTATQQPKDKKTAKAAGPTLGEMARAEGWKLNSAPQEGGAK